MPSDDAKKPDQAADGGDGDATVVKTTTTVIEEEEEEEVDVDALEEGMVVIDESLVQLCLWKMEEQIEGDEPERVAEFKAGSLL